LARAKTASAGSSVGRLEAQDWINAALGILAEQGVDGVRVEPLAKRLGVTKGSFYWHFKDRDALLERILEHWRRHATLDIIDRLERSADPTARVKNLLRIPFQGEKSDRGAQVELSIRLWGRRDAGARAALQEVDKLRLKYIQGLLEEVGLKRSEAIPRAIHAYSFMRVAGTLIDHADDSLIDACIAALLKR
jgi:AcrR family transcriptional regulator